MRMYSAEQRAKAIETFARLGCSAVDTVAKLGYSDRVMPCNWRKECQLGGDESLKRKHCRPRHSDKEKQGVVDHCLEHGKSPARTVRAIGCLSREVLDNWVDEHTLVICAVHEKG